MRHRLTILAVASLFAIGAPGTARGSPADPFVDVGARSAPQVVLVEPTERIDAVYDLNVQVSKEDAVQGLQQTKETASYQLVDKFHFDDRSTGAMQTSINPKTGFASTQFMPVAVASTSVLVVSARKVGVALRSRHDRNMVRSIEYPFTKAETLVRRRCRNSPERHAAGCGISTTSRAID